MSQEPRSTPAREGYSDEMLDSVRGVLQVLRNTKGATYKDVRVHCSMRGDDLSRWPVWIADAEGYVTEAGAADMIFGIMEAFGKRSERARSDSGGDIRACDTNKDADEIGVQRFAKAMDIKLAKKRDEGRGGWFIPSACPVEYLRDLLAEHVSKGDPVDIANLAMMIWNRENPNG